MTQNAEPNPQQISQVVEHLFRHESGKMIAMLVRIFGLEHLSLAEDVVQEALARALKTWPFYGIPQNPGAWIIRAARNLAVNMVRRQASFKGKETEIICAMEQWGASVAREEEIADDRLRLMFVCCHPAIPQEAQVALALKTLCGFGPSEIASAFLTTEAAISKRLTRAKQRIREAQIRFEIPEGEALAERLTSVLQALYLLFNEGYKASTGDQLIREDLCREAIRLTRLLVEHAAGRRPKTHALLALMLLNGARLPARVNAQGNLLRMADQDRSLWDRRMIAEGTFHLAHSAAGTTASRYHLEAGIAACHCTALDYASTDWPRILDFYTQLAEVDGSPIVALNRAVALAEVHGPEAGLEAVHQVENTEALQGYYLLHAVVGEFEVRRENFTAAAVHLWNAVQLAEIKSEKAFLSAKLAACEARQMAVRT